MKQTEIELLLPEVYRRSLADDGPLRAILAAMEALHTPAEHAIEHVDEVFDPLVAPDVFLPMLARWVDADRYLSSDREWLGSPGWLRMVIAHSAELAQWRGTARGLTLFLTLATGINGFVVEDDVTGPVGAMLPFHIRVRIPAAAATYLRLIRLIVETEKPAYVTYELTTGEQS